MTPPSLLILSGVRGDTRRYRSVHLAQQAALAGLQVTLAHVWQTHLSKQLAKQRFDVAVFQRVEMDRFIQRQVHALKTKETLILYDTDDLVFDQDAFKFIDSPDFKDPLRAKLYRKAMHRQKQMLLASDAALVSTTYLVKQVKRLNSQVWVHPNAFSQQMLEISEAALQAKEIQADRIVLGYASGTRTHNRDFASIAPVIKQFLVQYPKTQLWLVGKIDPGAGWECFGERVRRIPKVDWQQLPRYLAQFDINLAPLVAGNPFAESKSAIKYMEAALVKCPTIATNCAEFRTAIKDGETGFLATTEADWQEKLTRLIDDSALRQKMGEQAYQDVISKNHPSLRSEALLNTLNEISMSVRGLPFSNASLQEQALPQTHTHSTPQKQWNKAPGNFQRGWYVLLHRNLSEVLGGIWFFFRRLLEPIFPFH